MVRRMHPVVVTLSKCTRTWDRFLSPSLCPSASLCLCPFSSHFRENTPWIHSVHRQGKGISLSLSFSPSVSLVQPRVRARKNAGTAVIKIIGVIIFDREKHHAIYTVCVYIQRSGNRDISGWWFFVE